MVLRHLKEQERVHSSIRSEIWQIFNESEKEEVVKIIMKPLSITKPSGIKNHIYILSLFSETNGPILMKLAQKLLNYDI